MLSRLILMLFFMSMITKAWEAEPSNCAGTTFSDKQVKQIIDRERAIRPDLPSAFAAPKWSVRRQACYYVYIEYGLPETPENSHIFKLNSAGVIVDAQPGNPNCPDKYFSEAELSEIVKKERAKRLDLPQAFSKSRIRVDRLRCLYLYFEYAMPESRGNYQVFTIDPFGHVMEVLRPDPY